MNNYAAKISKMSELQDRVNKKVHPDWRNQNFLWYRAIWTECSELMDHHGWKWWKKQDIDVEQIKLEIVDIWHFGISIIIQRGAFNAENVAEIARPFLNRNGEILSLCCKDDILLDVEHIASSALNYGHLDMPSFFNLMRNIGMDFDELYVLYMSKNVLNIFRQNHGYNQGEYTKIWDGKEDNVHLIEITRTLDSDDPNYDVCLHDALCVRYTNLVD